ncbi:hypothetical protein [Victivallis lenta]|nr:hypothetical protein [Victivallis lenta]
MRDLQIWGARKPHRRDWRAESGEFIVWVLAAIAAAALVFME